jgi:hypothetical protein
MSIQDYDLFKAVNIVADFAGRDTTVRLNHSLRAYCSYDDSGFLPYETMLGKTMVIMSGITSSLSYMNLSIYQISHQDVTGQLCKDGYTEYDLYRYHYIVFSHSIALLQDLMFKLTSVIYSLSVPTRMIGWDKLEKELKKNNLSNIKQLFEGFYKCFSKHIDKRNGFSHEGLLTYNSLDNYYMTSVWTNSRNIDESKENMYPQFTKGSNENMELLTTTKDKFICELKQLATEAESYVISLCDLCFPKLLDQVDLDFFIKHVDNLKEVNNISLNKHLKKLGL